MNESVHFCRLKSLRQAMSEQGVAACVIPSADPHLSEYLPERWAGRTWLSGFDGSAGTLVVLADWAGLWTDSRYWVQAAAQLEGSQIELMKAGATGVATYVDALAARLGAGQRVAVDGATLSVGAAVVLREALGKAGATLCLELDLLDAIWHERPGLPLAPVFEHKAPWVGATRAQKLQRVRESMAEKGAQWHLISTLDDVAWLFNLRGSDVEYNPFFIAHALIGQEQTILFVDEQKFASDLRTVLAADGVSLRRYAEVVDALRALPQGHALLIDPKRVTCGMVDAAPATVGRIEAINPTVFFKSCKTDHEITHWRRVMEEDGAALVQFFSELEAAQARGEPISELTIDERITAARARRPHFVSPSFPTIAGFNGNGAMPHYRATQESHAQIAGDGLLLIDSGGQYLGGTTDITRVVAIGAVSDEQRRDFTHVLKGMIALSRAKFPRGTRSGQLDSLARTALWAVGMDYGHGTGHGVGYFLGVHEGPQSISPLAPVEPHTAMEPGMVTSNEPGVYRAGRWGVRIENLLLTVPDETNEFGEFLRFETLTLCPIDRRCIQIDLLSPDERAWLDAYHVEVRRRIMPLVSAAAATWLHAATEPLAT